MTATPRSRRDAPRLQQVSGAWVLAQDFRDAAAIGTLRLAQHHIAAHHSWGVSGGLVVTLYRGQLWVGAGCAVDRCGRTAILPAAVQLTYGENTAGLVALTLCGDGPQARVVVREPGRAQDLDIPLARIDTDGTVHDGDGDRQWLRRPGPCRRLGGVVPRGAPVVAGSMSHAWSVEVDLAAYRLEVPPAVVVVPAGAPVDPLVMVTTVQVTSLSETGFTALVRHAVNLIAGIGPTPVLTAPHAVSWLAVVPAARPEFPPEEAL